MKKIVWTSLLIVILLISGALFLLRELTYAQMPDLKVSARVALDNSAMAKINSVKPSAGSSESYVFLGQDKLGRALMVFATKDRVLGSEYQDKGLSVAKAEEKARQLIGYKEVSKLAPGILDPADALSEKASGKFVWEVYGINSNNRRQYAYLDFYTGDLLWTYTLNQTN